MVEKARELDAYGAGANDEQATRDLVGHHGLAVSPDELAIRLEPGLREGARPCAGGEDDMLGGVGLALHFHLRGFVAFGELGEAFDNVDFVLLHQELDALGELARDAARALDDRVEIEADLGLEPVGLGVLCVVIDLGRAQQRFGRDAAPVKANAT